MTRASTGAIVRVLIAQTRANFTWYFLRDSEMLFWSLAIPIFFLFVFSFALGGGTRGTSTFLVPGLIGAQVLSSGFWGVGAMLATFREKNVLRRIYLTPLPAWIFFASLVLYRMTLLAHYCPVKLSVRSRISNNHKRLRANISGVDLK